MRSNRKRTYRQIEEESKEMARETNHLLTVKKILEAECQDLFQELEYYKNLDNMQIDYKKKLDDLKDQGVIDDDYNIK